MHDLMVLRDAETPLPLLAALRRLVTDAFGDRFTDEDWAHSAGGWRVVLLEDGGPVSHAAVVPRTVEVAGRPFRTGYLEAVATQRGRRGNRLGSQVVREASQLVRERYELGALSTGSPDFYERLGWTRWGGPTFVRGAGGLVRTPDEDDGVMVLLHGPSAGVGLAAAISWEARPGDDW
ncbi:MAG: GNAT family N-acetyltransferase [Actinomycetota bacterium]